MFRKTDPYSYTQFVPLYLQIKSVPTVIGYVQLEYRVTLYNDVQVQNAGSVSQQTNQQFQISCTQRIALQNVTNRSIAPVIVPAADEAFNDYLAVIEASISITAGDGLAAESLTLELLDFSPQTVNTAVQQSTSNTDETGATSGVSTSNTTGSSQSQSSTYGVSVSVSAGMIGEVPMGSVTDTASYEKSSSSTTESSATNGSDRVSSAGNSASTSDSMSIKDWGSYAKVKFDQSPQSGSGGQASGPYPFWVFGQEYPWNALDSVFAYAPEAVNSNQQVQMYISTVSRNNLYDGIFLYPPSELSMFGLSFVMKSSWRAYVDYSQSASTAVNVPSFISLLFASHSLLLVKAATVDDLGNVTCPAVYTPAVYLDSVARIPSASTSQQADVTTSVDLNIMALDPVGVNNPAAIVGFIPIRLMPPVASNSGPASVGFKTLSATNDLIVQDTTDYNGAGSGFTVGYACLSANWTAVQNFPYSLTLYFKVTDFVSEYQLFMKHWLAIPAGNNAAAPVTLSIAINRSSTQPTEANTIVRTINAMEAEGGEDNLLTLSLRNLDFTSVDYHDYLQLGLNSITITMQPSVANSACQYQIRTVAVVKA